MTDAGMTAPEAAELPELPRGIALAWGVAASPQRGPKREMSVERIVDAAVALADAEGLGAVSMAAVAKRLGFTSMSLYRYVSAKDDLLLLMQEEATGLPPRFESEPAADGKPGDGGEPHWRARIERLYRAQVEIYLRHPWVLALPIEGSPVTPNSSAWLEASLTALAQTSLSPEERLAVSLAVSGQARWYGTVVAGYTETSRSTGMSPAEVARRENALFDAVIHADEFPQLRATVDAGVFAGEGDLLRFGVERLLDGVEAYVDGLDRGGPHEEPADWIRPDDEGVTDDKRYRAAAKATRDAQKNVLAAEKALRQARKAQTQALRDAKERLSG